MERYIKILNNVWFGALILDIMLTVMSLCIVFFKISKPMINQNNMIIFSFLTMAVIIFLVFYADKVIKRKIKKIRTDNLVNKLINYKSIYLRQLTCYMIISLVILIVIIFSMQIGYIIFSVLSIFLIIFSKARESKVKYDLALNQEELSQFNHIKFKK